MDFEKIAELQAMLAEYKRGAMQEQKARGKLKDAIPLLRAIASQINEIATSFTDGSISSKARTIQKTNSTPFRKYLVRLRDALNKIKAQNRTTRVQEAVAIGISDVAMYDFVNRGPVYNKTLAVVRIEEYVVKHGYDIEAMKIEAGYK